MPRSVNQETARLPARGNAPAAPTFPLHGWGGWDTIADVRRSRQLKPFSSEHHHALLVAFQLKQALAGHAESAGAPRDLKGLVALVKRFDDQVMRTHTQTEEDVLGEYLAPDDAQRLRSEHQELSRLVEAVKRQGPAEQRVSLSAFAALLERHVRWEEREIFPYAEEHVDADTLADIGGEVERRLVLARGEARNRAGRRTPT